MPAITVRRVITDPWEGRKEEVTETSYGCRRRERQKAQKCHSFITAAFGPSQLIAGDVNKLVDKGCGRVGEYVNSEYCGLGLIPKEPCRR